MKCGLIERLIYLVLVILYGTKPSYAESDLTIPFPFLNEDLNETQVSAPQLINNSQVLSEGVAQDEFTATDNIPTVPIEELLTVDYGIVNGQDYQYPYYNEYQNFDLTDFESLVNVTIRKCVCSGADEVLTSEGCEFTKTFVLTGFYTEVVLNTSFFGTIRTEDLSCPTGLVLLKLKYDNEFRLDMQGHLNFQGLAYDTNEYCFDHIFNENGDLSWEAKICHYIPKISRCCEPGKTMKGDMKCVKIEDAEMKPPVTFGGHDVDLGQLSGFETNITCDNATGDLVTRELVKETTYLELTNNGYHLWWKPQDAAGIVSRKDDEFCIYSQDEIDETKYYVNFCYKDLIAKQRAICGNYPCYRKCCPAGYYYDMNTHGCVKDTIQWTPDFYRSSTEKYDGPDFEYRVVYELPCDPTMMYQLGPHGDHDDFFLLTSGKLFIPNFNRSFEPQFYCIDRFGKENISVNILLCSADQVELTGYEAVQSWLYPMLMGISCFFLFLTLLVYATVPELHGRLHGKCLISHVLALLTAYLCLIIARTSSENLRMQSCIAIAIVMHLAFLSAFFWLNVMCFDIWWSLRAMRPVEEGDGRVGKKFLKYSLYAWGSASLLTGVVVTMQFLPADIKGLIRPGFGVRGCWFDGRESTWIYFYTWVTIICIVNIIFFGLVADIIVKARRDVVLLRRTQAQTERIWLYVKLFIVMGLTWIWEVLSAEFGPRELWFLTDFFNMLQGVFIFLIFICKRNTMRRVRSKYGPHLERLVKALRPSNLKTCRKQKQETADASTDASDTRGGSMSASRRTSEISLSNTSQSNMSLKQMNNRHPPLHQKLTNMSSVSSDSSMAPKGSTRRFENGSIRSENSIKNSDGDLSSRRKGLKNSENGNLRSVDSGLIMKIDEVEDDDITNGSSVSRL